MEIKKENKKDRESTHVVELGAGNPNDSEGAVEGLLHQHHQHSHVRPLYARLHHSNLLPVYHLPNLV